MGTSLDGSLQAPGPLTVGLLRRTAENFTFALQVLSPLILDPDKDAQRNFGTNSSAP